MLDTYTKYMLEESGKYEVSHDFSISAYDTF